MKIFLPGCLLQKKVFLLLLVNMLVAAAAFAQPSNDLCTAATPLTSSTACVTTAGTLRNATVSIPAIATTCGTAGADVWYSFVAQSVYPNITISSPGTSLGTTNARIQLFSGTCGSLTSLGCVTGNSFTTLAAYPAGLTIGVTYYFRVYSNTVAPTTGGSAWTYNICVTDLTPANDNCSGAVTLTSAAGCSATTGTIAFANPSAAPSICGVASSADVWYRYVATTAFPTITLSYNGGTQTNFKAASPAVELLSGTCAGLTEVTCMNGTPSTNSLVLSPGGLTVGSTYFIRVFTNTNTGLVTGSNYGFSICITDPSATAPTLDYGKGYINTTKGSGGTIEPGDQLEIRATFVVKANTAYRVSFSDNIPTGTTYVPNTLRILTNEGKIYQQFTDAAADDPGTFSAGTVTINIGSGATAANGGAVRNTNRPTNFGSTCILIASYRVTVNAVPLGTPINLGGGSISYRNQPVAATNTITFPTVNAVVYQNYGICVNTVGSNGILSESGGTFGSGNLKDRGASSKVPTNYNYFKFSNSDPQDYRYGVSNNSSSGGVNYSFIPNDPVAVNHVFNVWDIIGDHTGAASPTAGNPPADTTGGKTGGYMVVINAAFRTDTAFLDTVKNLCPNTYYEYSAWFRNICKRCGADSIGISPTAFGYIPTGPGDSSGVHPNLTFNINGYDYYSTGDILYDGQWIKKGFTYLTGPAQTQMIISIRNNAPGGGGNDWAIDDIGVATCTPNLALNPSTPLANVCAGDGLSLSANVQSFFNNYTEYIWERSTDNGVNWTSTGFAGTGTPVFNGTDYSYTAVGPSFIGDVTTHHNLFRLRVASTAANILDPNCSFSGIRTVMVYVNNCMWLLKTDITGISGQLQNNYAGIQWHTANETAGVIYIVEKSTDGAVFLPVGTVKGDATGGTGHYTFNDPQSLTSAAYYRIKIMEEAQYKFTKTVLLNPGKLNFDVKNMVNPFAGTLQFDVVLPAQGDVKTTLFDNSGKVVRVFTTLQARKGLTTIKIPQLEGLSSGIYTMKTIWQQESVSKRVIKVDN
jgi:trimeric autotransporter adhesin